VLEPYCKRRDEPERHRYLALAARPLKEREQSWLEWGLYDTQKEITLEGMGNREQELICTKEKRNRDQRRERATSPPSEKNKLLPGDVSTSPLTSTGSGNCSGSALLGPNNGGGEG
jgi:hypothetical protein